MLVVNTTCLTCKNQTEILFQAQLHICLCVSLHVTASVLFYLLFPATGHLLSCLKGYFSSLLIMLLNNHVQ